jgi:hypothetical protein
MNNIEKHEAVREYLATHPDQSDRQIAGHLGVSPTFVGKVRRFLEAKGKLTNVETRQGQDGRWRRHRRTRNAIERDELQSRLDVIERELAERTKRYEHDRIKRHEYHVSGFSPYPHDLEAERDRILKKLKSLKAGG